MISTMITLSTSHITEDAEEWLDSECELAMEGKSVIPVSAHRHGWCVFSADLDDFEHIPASLLSVAQWCRCRGISHIRFDHGADAIDDIPCYMREVVL